MSSIYKKKENIVTRDIAGETLLVPVHGKLADMQKIFALDSVAAFIWEKLNGKTALQEICEAVSTHFDVNPNQAEADTREFVRELLDAGLVEA